MRPIDAETVAEKMRHMYCDDCDFERRERCKNDPLCLFLAYVDNAPTLDVEPVRHGRLRYRHVNPHHIPSSCKVICMECGYEKSRLDGEIIRYCQYCGAKMDLKGD